MSPFDPLSCGLSSPETHLVSMLTVVMANSGRTIQRALNILRREKLDEVLHVVDAGRRVGSTDQMHRTDNQRVGC